MNQAEHLAEIGRINALVEEKDKEIERLRAAFSQVDEILARQRSNGVIGQDDHQLRQKGWSMFARQIVEESDRLRAAFSQIDEILARQRGGKVNAHGEHSLPREPLVTTSHDGENTYTVTIAGVERHDGQEPWTCVVNATTERDAIVKAAAFVSQSACEPLDFQFVSIMEGVPPHSCGYHWNDLRPPKKK